MRYFISFLFFALSISVAYPQNTEWISQHVSGSVTVFFPSTPSKNDTIGQTMYFVNEGKDLMLATVAPIPTQVQPISVIQKDSLLNNFIQSVISNSTQLIYSDVEYKGLNAKYYKVRVDEINNPIKGLIADSYNFILNDTIYSISYLRYNATELFDYNKQRMFFDMVVVNSSDENKESGTAIDTTSTYSSSTVQKDNSTNTMNFIAIAVLIVGIMLLIYRIQNRKNKGHFD